MKFRQTNYERIQAKEEGEAEKVAGRKRTRTEKVLRKNRTRTEKAIYKERGRTRPWILLGVLVMGSLLGSAGNVQADHVLELRPPKESQETQKTRETQETLTSGESGEISDAAETQSGHMIGQDTVRVSTPSLIAPYVGGVIDLDDVGICVTAGAFEEAEQKDGYVYLYTMRKDTIPYVIIGRYDVQAENFVPSFTDYMKSSYADLHVAREAEELTIGDNLYSRIVYEYSSGDHVIRDTRMFCEWGTATYMFGSKEILSMGYLIPDGYLYQVAGSIAPLAGDSPGDRKYVDAGHSLQGPRLSAEETAVLPEMIELGGVGMAAPVILGEYGSELDQELIMDEDNQDEGREAGPDEGQGQEMSLDEGQGQELGPDEGQEAGPDQSLSQEAGHDGSRDQEAGPDEGQGQADISHDAQDRSADLNADAYDYDGSWILFEDGFRLCLPNGWGVQNLSEDEVNSGALFCAGEFSGIPDAPFISVSWAPAGEAATLEEASRMVTDMGYQLQGIVSVNGISCVHYRGEAQDVEGLLFFHPRSMDYMIAVCASGIREHKDMQLAILASLTLGIN